MTETVSAISRRITECDIEQLPSLLAALQTDGRAGVRAAVARGRRRIEHHRAESQRLEELARFEAEIRSQGFSSVAGVDEVGRGALAGPVTVGLVILPPDARIVGINDSKRLSPQAREALVDPIVRSATALQVVHLEAIDIDSMGIVGALRECVLTGLAALDPSADHVISDGNGFGGLPLPETPLVKADSRCAAVAAASVLAKVVRDALMVELDAAHPGYGLALNKGYGTADHIRAIHDLGPSPVHRRSFAPCADDARLF